MRLLNTESLEVHGFLNDEEIPPYATLSHRWEAQEVSLQDFEAGTKRDGAGYAKILGACEQARSIAWKSYNSRGDHYKECTGLDWIWIDTCCIDKTSSAELSEAINSMFKWYERSAVCIVYLSDVAIGQDGTRLDVDGVLDSFRKSTWFERGWTLQELLAPIALMFWDRDWRMIGAKEDLLESIGSATGIPRDVLKPRANFWRVVRSSATDNPRDVPKQPEWKPGWRESSVEMLQYYSVAQKMSWAARRKTTRVEDLAYCLLGLFQINMPLLYGEGQAAFRRLQLEIVRTSDDESIFAWDREIYSQPKHALRQSFVSNEIGSLHGLLASEPGQFASCQDVQVHRFFERQPFSVTNRGLHFEAVYTHHLPGLNGIEESDFITFRKVAFPLNCTSDLKGRYPLMLQVVQWKVRDTVKEIPPVWWRLRILEGQARAVRWQFWPFNRQERIYIII